MEAVKEYVFGIISSAVLCCIAEVLLNKNSTIGQLGKMLCGLILIISIISPLKQISLPDIAGYLDTINTDAYFYANEGKTQAKSEAANIIKSKTEAYILDKANKMHCNINVEIAVSDGDELYPCAVIITGSVSPYAKEVLSTYIEESLGIIKEKQTWNSDN